MVDGSEKLALCSDAGGSLLWAHLGHQVLSSNPQHKTLQLQSARHVFDQSTTMRCVWEEKGEAS